MTTPGWVCLLRGQEKFYADGGKAGLLGEYQAREVDAEIDRLRRIIEEAKTALLDGSPMDALQLLESEGR